jgi:methyltransferase
MRVETPVPVPVPALVAYVTLLAVERIGELVVSRQNARQLLALGAEEHGRAHYPWFVALHVLYPLGLIAEVVWGGARPGPFTGLWLALFLAAQVLRFAVIRALGPYWTVRILVHPGMQLVRRGPYRWLRHPNYVAVVLEFLSGALLFGAWRTALAATACYLVLLKFRVPVEERALRAAVYMEKWSPTP